MSFAPPISLSSNSTHFTAPFYFYMYVARALTNCFSASSIQIWSHLSAPHASTALTLSVYRISRELQESVPLGSLTRDRSHGNVTTWPSRVLSNLISSRRFDCHGFTNLRLARSLKFHWLCSYTIIHVVSLFGVYFSKVVYSSVSQLLPYFSIFGK